MKHFPASRWAAFAIVGCLAHTAGQGATAGRSQGAVLIGRPLDVTVPLVVEGAGDTAPECAESEVFYGDGKVPASNVATELLAGPRGPFVRVRSGAAVNEPVVTVYLQLGCGSRFTRKLVLLAEPDPAVDVQRPLPAAPAATRSEIAGAAVNSAPLNPSMSRGLPAAAEPAAQVQRAQRKRPIAPAAAPRATTPTAQPARPVAPPRGVAQSKPTGAAPQAQAAPAQRDQLKLDAPLGVAEPAPPSEEQLRQAARLQAIERDLGEMRQFLKRNDASMLQLQAQLAHAEAERYANPLVYVLLGLVLLMTALMAYFWRRAVRARESAADDWWRSPRAEREAGHAAAASAGTRQHDTHDDTRKPASSATLSVASAGVGARSAAADLQTPTVRVPLVTARTDDFQSSHGAIRALKAEELHDVQQEADFFSSLGEYDRAIEVLRSHIQAYPETSAVAWLDLLEIYHKLGRREEFEWVRREFRQRFNAQVPAFDDYSQESAGIEAYDNAMARIAALWPSRRVLDVIEESIFRGPSKDGTEAFSLQAYRELLLLHHIGQQVLVAGEGHRSQFGDSGPISGPQSDSGSPGFSHTSIHPLSTGLAAFDEVSDQRVREHDARHDARDFRAREPEAGQSGGLDLNLDDLPAHVAADADANLLDFDLPDISAPAQTQLSRTRH